MTTILANKSSYRLLLSLWSSYLFSVALIFTVFIMESVLTTTTTTNIAYAQEADQVQKLWETPAQLKTPESVLYEPTENVLFASIIDGKSDEKDGQGFVSKVSPVNGTIIELNWITGLNAPKGMAVSDDSSKLYVSDITDLVEIDIANGQITNRYNAPGITFLNDVASDKQGNIYVSDTGSNSIYKLEISKTSPLQIWLQTPELNSPNGLYVDNSTNKLVVASLGGSLSLVDLENKTIIKGTQVPGGSLDGIEGDTGENLYYVTDWAAGKVYAVNSDGTDYRTLIDLQKQGTADLEFIADERIVIIPMMQDNKLVAYRILE
jgi:sugar lactone lactonase YvrE